MMISRIGIFRALYLGDMLCIIPTIRSVRRAFPHAKLFLIGLPWQRDFVKRFSHYFDEFIEFPGWPGLPEQQPDVENILRFLQHIRTFQFDLLLQMQGNGEITNSMCMLWGAKKVCGLRKAQGYAPDDNVFPVSEDDEHEILRFLKLAAALQLPPDGEELEFPLFAEEQQRALEILREAGLNAGEYVCLHPGARDPRRRWAAEKFAAIAESIIKCGYTVMLTGSEEERVVINAVQQHVHGPVLNIVELYGHLGLGELAALLSKSKLLVSNDTGVSHLASAMEVPSVIIFSPYSDLKRWHPLNKTLHIAIPSEHASDVQFVKQTVAHLLTGDKMASVHTHALV